MSKDLVLGHAGALDHQRPGNRFVGEFSKPDFSKLERASKNTDEARETNNRSDEIAWLIDTISSANELMDEVNKVCLFEQAINDRIAKLRAMR